MTTSSKPLKWLITGVSQGFGKALAAEVLSRGDEVVAIVREPATVEDLVSRHGNRIRVERGDLITDDGLAHATAVAQSSPIDVLVNNAGRAIIGAAEEVSLADLREQVELNFFAAADFLTTLRNSRYAIADIAAITTSRPRELQDVFGESWPFPRLRPQLSTV